MFEPTCVLRIHRFVYEQTWSTQWDDRYIDTIQQKWINKETQEEEWRPLEIVREEKKNMIMWG